MATATTSEPAVATATTSEPVAATANGPDRGSAREQLLDAVSTLLSDRPWAEVRMVDVGAEAGVSRQTVYNTFGTREGLAQAYVVREAAAFLAAVEGVIRANSGDPVRALTAALEIFLGAVDSHPLVRAISASDSGDELLTLVTTRGGPVLDALTGRLGQLIAETWPTAAPASAALAADTLVRLAISHAALPGAAPTETAAQIATILAPFIEREVATAG